MAFKSPSERLGKAFKSITGKGELSEKNTNDMLREACMSLLEADINYGVVKDPIARIKEQALGTGVMISLNPGQMVVKVVCDETVTLLGNEDAPINYKSNGITTVMMMGLQGTGRTTASVEIVNVMRKKQNRKPLLVAYDVIRSVATEQLKALGKSIGVEAFPLGVETKALETAKQSMDYAKESGYDAILFSIVGHLHIDEELMQELSGIKAFVHPDDILLAVDAITGQGIVNVVGSFHEQLKVTGLVLIKLDGNSKGGDTLSVRPITQIPVKFIGLGEKIDDLGVFYPDCMADRILGMGGIIPLVEQAQDKVNIGANMKPVDHTMSGQFTLTSMLIQPQQLEKMGSLGGMMKLILGMNQLAGQIDEAKAGDKTKKSIATIQSTTTEERENLNILRASRENCIAKGSDTTIADIDRPLNEYEKMKQVMKRMGAITKSGKMPDMGGMGTTGTMKDMRSMNRMMRQGGKRGRR